jgi:HEAT repeat protein
MAEAAGSEAARRVALDTSSAMCNGDADGAFRAADVLVWLGAESVEPLIVVLAESRHVRLPAIVALGYLGDLRASGPLVEHLSDGDAAVRAAAATALGEIADPSVSRALLPLTVDSDPGVRAAALAVLQRLGPLTAIDSAEGEPELEREETGGLFPPSRSWRFGR